MMALQRQGLLARLAFACEKEEQLRGLIRQRHGNDVVLYDDIQTRDNRRAPKVDLLIGGPPCQSWSSAGARKGLEDPRGPLLYSMLEYVEVHRPKVVVLENVVALVHTKNQGVLEEACQRLKMCGYVTDVRILNTMDHGLPQSRRRLYLVALQAPIRRMVEWPQPLKHRISACRLFPRRHAGGDAAAAAPEVTCARGQALIAKSLEEARAKGYNPETTPIFVDVAAGKSFEQWTAHICPCLTRSRGQSGGFWVSTLGRKMTVPELFKLQGIRPADVPWEKSDITRTAIGGAIGNAMSVNVLQRLLPEVCYAAGLISHDPASFDLWRNPKYNPFA